ncbi:MAG TPA: bifunctional glycoside hydrolase 114/ polysaccharide deacetylase family protein [Dongiaceae bacterium]|nr:bifunctional glycoside hydrolase 114/ polysaccharide deacetylase family protein [Dongiaceae bacterium]
MIVIRWLLAVVLACSAPALAAPDFGAPRSAAFYYGTNHPIDELKAFDLVVVDPDSGITPSSYGAGPSELFAYVSVGETNPSRPYAGRIKPAWIVGTNGAWGSMVMDPANPEWRTFFLDRVIAPLWEAGYKGFFLDTLDSYQLATKRDDTPREEGLAAMILAIKTRYPEAKLILNRGFEVFERVKRGVYAVAAESLFQRYDAASGTYGEVPEEDRVWLRGKLDPVKAGGIPVIAIDYVPPGKRDLARTTAGRIQELGYMPWVADMSLASLGVGAVEVMPRRILGLYDGAEASDPAFTDLHRFGVMPLNYLGYRVELHDMRTPLPDLIMDGRYAGVVVWPISDSSGNKSNLTKWVLRRFEERVPVVFMDSFGIPPGSLPENMGVELTGQAVTNSRIKVVVKDPMIGFETPPLPQVGSLVPYRLTRGRLLLKIADQEGVASDAAAITDWGGYVLAPFSVLRAFGDQAFWVIDPFRFFREALRLPEMPVPDTTTENGVRLLMAHVDGDGFENRAEWQGGGYAGSELRTRILEKYRIPVTVSVITGLIAPNGIYPEKTAEFEKIAREIFALPWVEPASHSFSHPFNWQAVENSEGHSGYNRPIPGYRFNLDAEINGSLAYINSRLLPQGKKARVFQWSGNCTPSSDAIAMTYSNGIAAINGGETIITDSRPSMTAVAPLGIYKKGWFQVFAPNQNENVYTNLWTDSFYGYRRVLETFRLTDTPRRMKPVDIYYHFYSATKTSSLKSLETVYGWAAGKNLNSIFISDYIEKVHDFNRTVVARKGSGWLIRNSGALREFRISASSGYPGPFNRFVAGFSDHNDQRYLHLAPGEEAEFSLLPRMDTAPYIISFNGQLKRLARTGRDLTIALQGHVPLHLELGNVSGCSLRMDRGAPGPVLPVQDQVTVGFPEGEHEVSVSCQ